MPSKTHPWIYVIIPMAPGGYDQYLEGEKSYVPTTGALFAAFCKDCRTYFSESVPYDSTGLEPVLTKSSLPREGCIVEEVADEGFSSLPGVDR